MSPPGEIDGAKVLCYTKIDDRHRHTGKCRHIVGDALQGAAAGLAICQYADGNLYYLFYCDADWFALTDTCHASLAEAQAQAEFEYEGVFETWEYRK